MDRGVCVEGAGRNLPSLHLAHDLSEIIRLSVAAGEERGLALVKLWVGEGEVLPHHTHQHIAPAMRKKAETALHGRDVSRGIDHHVEAVAVSRL